MKNNNIKHYIWNILGSSFHSINSLLLLIIVSHINGLTEAGYFSYGFVLANIILVIMSFGGRNYQLTDNDDHYSTDKYVSFRIITSFITLSVCIILLILFNNNIQKTIIIVLLILVKTCESISDVFYAIMQKENRTDLMGKSLFYKNIIAIVVFAITNLITKNLCYSILSFLLVYIIFLLFFDLFLSKKYKNIILNFKDNFKDIFKSNLFVFLYSFLGIFIINIPRYFIDILYTSDIQAIYSMIIMPSTLIYLLSAFILTPNMVSLAALYKNNKINYKNKFKRIIYITICISIFITIFFTIFGIDILNILYNINLNNSHLLMLFISLIASSFYAIVNIISAHLLICRKNIIQTYIFLITGIIGCVITFYLTKHYNLVGSFYSYFIIMSLLLTMYVIVTVKKNDKQVGSNKILVVCQHFYPEEFRINDICYELVKRNYDVTVLTGLPNYPKGKIYKGYGFFKKKREKVNGVKIIRTSIIPRGNNNISIAINYVSFAVNACIKSLFIKKDYDLVISYQLSPISMVWPGIVVSKIKKIPLYIYVQDQWPASMLLGGVKKDSLSYKFFYNMSKYTYNKADKILVSSEKFIDYFKCELKINNKEFIYLPNYAEECYKITRSINNNKIDLLFAGNIGPAQSVETIVKCANEMKENKKYFFHIVGDGLSKTICEELSKEYKLKNIKFYGRKSIEEVLKYYDLADILLITMEDNEVINNTIPTKIQSYLASGKPIFGCVNGTINEIINENKCGIVVKAYDYKLLADSLLKITDKQIKDFSNNCIKYYNDKFDKQKVQNELEKIINKSLKK